MLIKWELTSACFVVLVQATGSLSVLCPHPQSDAFSPKCVSTLTHFSQKCKLVYIQEDTHTNTISVSILSTMQYTLNCVHG